jgi:hypothetical protein
LRILVDDEKTDLPDGSSPDIILRNYGIAADWLVNYWCSETYDRSRDELYLDHDLGEKLIENTGYKLICAIEEAVFYGMTLPRRIVCVSNNPAGRARIQQVIAKLYRENNR